MSKYLIVNTWDVEDTVKVEVKSDIDDVIRAMLIRNAADGEFDSIIEVYEYIGQGHGNITIHVSLENEEDTDDTSE